MRKILALALLLGFLPLSASAGCGSSSIESLCAFLAEDLVGNLQVRLDRTAPIMTAPFADLHGVKQTSELGRILAEATGSNLSRYGYTLADPRAFMPNPYTLKEYGQTALSAEPDQAGAATGAQTILTGTYALADGGVLVAARLVQVQNHIVLSTASCRLRLTEEVRALLSPSQLQPKAVEAPVALLNLKHKADAKRVQQALHAQGLYRGKIDGVWGRKSRAALARFRASIALPATADWDLDTQKALLPAS